MAELNQVQKILAMFLAAQLLGVFVGVTLIYNPVDIPDVKELNVAPGGASSDPATSLFFLGYMLFGAVGILLLLKYYKGVFLFRVLEALTLFVASNIVFIVLFAWLFHFAGLQMPELPFLFAFLASSVFTGAKFFFPQLRNVAAVVASAGVGAVFGFSLDLYPAALFAIGLSVYDYLSVFWTGHMVYMARELAGRNLAFSIAATDPQKKGAGTAARRSPSSTLELGTGDIVIPLLLAVAAYKLSYNPLDSIAVVFGGVVGLVFVLWFVSSRKTFLPALPPLTFCSLLSLGIAQIAKLLLAR